MPDLYVELLGQQTCIKVLALAGERTPLVLTTALLEEANLAFRRSQVKVPFRKGILKGSGRVHAPVTVFEETFVEISYGGAASAYAWIMHNGIMHGKPINYRKGKQAHYLSEAVEEIIPGFESRLIARMQSILA